MFQSEFEMPFICGNRLKLLVFVYYLSAFWHAYPFYITHPSVYVRTEHLAIIFDFNIFMVEYLVIQRFFPPSLSVSFFCIFDQHWFRSHKKKNQSPKHINLCRPQQGQLFLSLLFCLKHIMELTVYKLRLTSNVTAFLFSENNVSASSFDDTSRPLTFL